MIDTFFFRQLRTVVPLALVLLLTTACGGADEGSGAATEARPSTVEQGAAAPSSGSAGAVADVPTEPTGREGSMESGGDDRVASAAPEGEGAPASIQGELPLVRVWKAPTCGCCGDWVEHVRAAGFPVEVHDVEALTEIKEEHGITAEHRSCHTATVGGYVVEGHVPAELIVRMLEERPEIRGLAVPGMPVGSPGMEVGDRKDPYDVLALLTGGSVVVYDSR